MGYGIRKQILYIAKEGRLTTIKIINPNNYECILHFISNHLNELNKQKYANVTFPLKQTKNKIINENIYTFDELFSSEKNKTLSGYLTQIYRFLGLYVVGIGTFLLAFSSEKILKLPYLRIRIFYVLGTLLIVNLIASKQLPTAIQYFVLQ